MKKYRKGNKGIFISFIVLFLFTMWLMPFGETTIFSDEEQEKSNNSGGFVVESDRVEGYIDLIGSLFGKVNIAQGQIHGLKITKKLETNGSEPLIIKISSPGPIPISNLKAETIDGGMPELGGLCLAEGNPTWLCLKDVKMVVDEQSVSAITLPNARIVTCYESECGPLPEVKSLSLEQLLEFLSDDSTEHDSVEDLISKLEQNLLDLQQLESLIEDLSSSIEALLAGDGDINGIEGLLDELGSLLSIQSITDPLKLQIASLTDELSNKFNRLEQETARLEQLANEIETNIANLETTIQENEEALEEIENDSSPDEEKQISEEEQLAAYAGLLQQVDEEELQNALPSKEMNIQIEQAEDEETESEIDVDKWQEEITQMKEKLERAKEQYEQLSKKLTELLKQKKTLEQNIEEQKPSLVNILKDMEDNDQSRDSENSNDEEKEESSSNDTNEENENDDPSSNDNTNPPEQSEPTEEEDSGNDDTAGNNEDDSDEEEEKDNGNIITDLLDWLFNW